jgi:hypothetical protein
MLWHSTSKNDVNSKTQNKQTKCADLRLGAMLWHSTSKDDLNSKAQNNKTKCADVG